MNVKNFIIAALLLLVPTAAVAEDTPAWIEVPTDEDDLVMHVRRAEIHAGRSHQTSAKLWIKYVLSGEKVSTHFKTAMVRYTVNCPAQTFQKLNHAYYLASGEVKTDNTPGKIEAVIPESNMDVVVTMLCSDPEAS